MLKKTSKIVGTLLIFSMFLSMNMISVSAQTDANNSSGDLPVSVNFVYISSFMNSFDITDSDKASVASKTTADNFDEVHISGLLQQYTGVQWKTIKTWYMETSDTDGFSETYFVVINTQYFNK